MLVSLAAGATAAVSNPWTGRWSRPASEFGGSSAGVTTLTQNGSSVTGSYDWSGGGTITNTVASGNSLDGNWSSSKSDGSGTFHFTLSSDATSFTGTWKATSGKYAGQGGAWSGRYVGTRPAPPPTTTPPRPVTTPPTAFPRYRFSFTVKREPALREPFGPLYVRTDARGTGSFETGPPAANGNQVVGNAKGGVAVINRYVHENHFIAMNIVHNQGYYRRGVLVLRTVITRSDEKGCAPGKTGMLKLVHSSRGDAVELDVCSFTLVFASAERSHVSVTIIST